MKANQTRYHWSAAATKPRKENWLRVKQSNRRIWPSAHEIDNGLWKYFVIVVLGLIECEERKTLSSLLRVIGEQVSVYGLSRFLNRWNWSPAEVVQSWLLHFRQRMEALVQAEHSRLKAEQPKPIGRPKQTVVTGFLIFDDSVHNKPKGQKMGGMGYHYSNTEQKVVAGHCLFTGLSVALNWLYAILQVQS